MAGLLEHLINPDVGIKENKQEKYFEFYVAGYTKVHNNIHVQANHVLLFTNALMIASPDTKNDNTLLSPFASCPNLFSVRLVPDSTNRYDENALLVQVDCPIRFEQHILEKGELSTKQHDIHVSLTLGYVPKRISKVVKLNLQILGKGWIKKVRRIHNNKHYVTKVAIPWESETKVDRTRDLVNRLSIALDID
jgi:hypothetical protein